MSDLEPTADMSDKMMSSSDKTPFGATDDNSAEGDVEEGDPLHVTTQEWQSIPMVVAQGDVDLATTHVLRVALEAACQGRSEPGLVALDMREVPFIDSAGLALLVEIRRRFFETCQLALLIERASQPERVLRLGRFDTFLKVCYAPEELTATSSAVA